MDSILVAVDGSKHTEKVVQVATELAKKTSSEIILAYVIKAPAVEPERFKDYEKVENYRDAYAAYLQEIGNDILSKIRSKLAESKISCKTLVETGNPADRILEIAKVEEPMLIILGLRGLHGVERIRSLGSVARRIIENSKFWSFRPNHRH